MRNTNIHHLKITDSTNEDAQRGKSTSPDKSVWIADFQTAGRGQRGNCWESEAGKNMTFSILLKPERLVAERQFVISQVVSLGVVHYLASKGVVSKIKWSNDIYVGDRKICGMLIVHSVLDGYVNSSIAGIGLNLNQTLFASDAPNPTSLVLEGGDGKEFDIEKELPILLDYIFSLYDTIGDENGEIEREYSSLLYRKDEMSLFVESKTGEKFQGIIRGVDSSARLIIELPDGTSRHFNFQEVKFALFATDDIGCHKMQAPR